MGNPQPTVTALTTRVSVNKFLPKNEKRGTHPKHSKASWYVVSWGKKLGPKSTSPALLTLTNTSAEIVVSRRLPWTSTPLPPVRKSTVLGGSNSNRRPANGPTRTLTPPMTLTVWPLIG